MIDPTPIEAGRRVRARRRLVRLATASAAGAGRAVVMLPGLAGAAAVVTGVAFEEHHGHGVAWIVAGCFGLLAGWELNRKGR